MFLRLAEHPINADYMKFQVFLPDAITFLCYIFDKSVHLLMQLIMNKSSNLLSYVFVALCTVGLMFPILSFILVDNNSESKNLQMKVLADTTVSITFERIGLTDPPTGKFEPENNARVAIDSFKNLWNNAPSGIIQIARSKITKSDLFSISALDSLLDISNNTRYRAKYLAIIKGIDPISGNLKSYLALVDNDLKIIKQSENTTYIQEGGRCPDLCPE